MITYKSKQVRFGVEIVALNNTDYIEAIINMFKPFVDQIAVLAGKTSWKGNVKSTGEVAEIVKKYADDKVELVEGNWKTEVDQRNEGLERLKICDYVLIVDDDEMWGSDNIHKIQDYILQHAGYTVFMASWNTRFKKLNWRVEPREPFKPVIAINNRKGLRFGFARLIADSPQAANILIPEKIAVIEHFSYVRSEPHKIKEKIQTFSHANEIINGIDFWYEQIYLQADLDSKYLHPTSVECYDHLIEDELDSEIEDLLKKYSPQLFV